MNIFQKLRLDTKRLRDITDGALSGPRHAYGLEIALRNVSNELDRAEGGRFFGAVAPAILYVGLVAGLAFLAFGCGAGQVTGAYPCEYSYTEAGLSVCADTEVKPGFVEAAVAATDEAIAEHYQQVGSLEKLLADNGVTLYVTVAKIGKNCWPGPLGTTLCEDSPFGLGGDDGHKMIVNYRPHDACMSAGYVTHELVHLVERLSLDVSVEDMNQHTTPGLFSGPANAWYQAHEIFKKGFGCGG